MPYEQVRLCSDILRKQIDALKKRIGSKNLMVRARFQTNPHPSPMTSASSAAAVWFLYKLFSDLGIYYYFAGEKEGEGRKEGRKGRRRAAE